MHHGHRSILSTLKGRFKALDLHTKSLILGRPTVEKVNKDVQKELDVNGENLRSHKIWASLKKPFFVRKENIKNKKVLN